MLTKDCSRKKFIKNIGKVTAGAIIGGPVIALTGCSDVVKDNITDGTVEAAPYPFEYKELDFNEVQTRTFEKYMEGG